ncbi:unnamed protein product [Oncorhynchus mykiss]|uniref:Uncharacterized protein n=1 Tax=Oncorhynchus mykiss TaxID=8022 RepID=A0A061ACU9_ONCMY|nr:unnamed protein product [Oncorhynchus mykiss]
MTVSVSLIIVTIQCEVFLQEKCSYFYSRFNSFVCVCSWVCRVAVEALRILLARAQLDHVVKPLDQEGAWDKMKDPQQHITGVTLLARCVVVFRAMAKHAGPRLPAIVECLCPCLNNIYECQRVTITAFFSEVSQAQGPLL